MTTLATTEQIRGRIITRPSVITSPGWGKVSSMAPVLPVVNPQSRFLNELRRINEEANRSVLMLVTGPQGTGKSRFVGRLLSTLDPRYIPSMENHPVYTKNQHTSIRCHISISLMPFLRAVVDELLLMRQGKRGDLPPGSWWHIDEPTDALSIEWWKKTAKILGKFLMRNGYMRVNVAICAQIKGKTLGYLRELCNAWVRMRKPGHATVFKMESRINYKSVTRPEYTKPVGLWKVHDETNPPPKWDELYGPIKDANAIQGALEDILDLQSVSKSDPEMKDWLANVKNKMGYKLE